MPSFLTDFLSGLERGTRGLPQALQTSERLGLQRKEQGLLEEQRALQRDLAKQEVEENRRRWELDQERERSRDLIDNTRFEMNRIDKNIESMIKNHAPDDLIALERNRVVEVAKQLDKLIEAHSLIGVADPSVTTPNVRDRIMPGSGQPTISPETSIGAEPLLPSPKVPPIDPLPSPEGPPIDPLSSPEGPPIDPTISPEAGTTLPPPPGAAPGEGPLYEEWAEERRKAKFTKEAPGYLKLVDDIVESHGVEAGIDQLKLLGAIESDDDWRIAKYHELLENYRKEEPFDSEELHTLVEIFGRGQGKVMAGLLTSGQQGQLIEGLLASDTVARVPFDKDQVKILSELEIGLLKARDLRNLIPENREVFGPIWGRLAPYLYGTPLREKALKMEAQFAFVRQWVGKAMEGGVLRKEDEIKYRTMLGQLTDPAKIVEFKLDEIVKALWQQYDNYVKMSRAAGSALDPELIHNLPFNPYTMDDKAFVVWSREWGKTKTSENSKETVNDVFKRRYPEVYAGLYSQ